MMMDILKGICVAPIVIIYLISLFFYFCVGAIMIGLDWVVSSCDLAFKKIGLWGEK